MFIPHLNSYWAELGTRGEIVVWPVLFEGVFQVEFRDGAPPDNLPGYDPEHFAGANSDTGLLRVEAGELTVCDPEQLGDVTIDNCIQVTPGTYTIKLRGSNAEQQEHEFISLIEDYPAGDGPDWIVYLTPYPNRGSDHSTSTA